MSLQIVLICIFCVSVGFGQFPPGDFGGQNSGIGGPSQSVVEDTTKREPFAYHAYNLNNLRKEHGIIDTLINNIHRVEPYYNTFPLGGNLGSEYSSGYDFFYDYGHQALDLGQKGHHHLLNQESSKIIYTPNRDFFEVQYSGSYPIDGNQFKLAYYKPFARNIFINANYTSLSDEGALSNQNASFKEVNLMLLQKSASGRRITYVQYDNARITEAISRSQNESASIFNQNRKVEIGNSLLLGDSLSLSKGNHRLDSRFTWSKEVYQLNDASVSTEEQSLYQFAALEGVLLYLTPANRFSLLNKYYKSIGNGALSIGLDVSSVSATLDSTSQLSFFTTQFLVEYEREIGASGRLEAMFKWGLADVAGDLRSSIQFSQKVKSIKYNIRALYEKISPSLSQRFLFANELVVDDYHLNAVQKTAFKAGLESEPLGLELRLSFSLYNSLLIPSSDLGWDQLSTSVKTSNVSISKQLDFGPLKSRHQVYYQYISSDLIPRPEYQYYGNVYFNLDLFKKKMSTQWGLDVYYIPSFETPAFQPLLGQWYRGEVRQQSEDILIINPYLNVKVDRLFFFVKGINVSRQFLPQSPTWGGSYPIFNYRVRFGLRWTLLD